MKAILLLLWLSTTVELSYTQCTNNETTRTVIYHCTCSDITISVYGCTSANYGQGCNYAGSGQTTACTQPGGPQCLTPLQASTCTPSGGCDLSQAKARESLLPLRTLLGARTELDLWSRPQPIFESACSSAAPFEAWLQSHLKGASATYPTRSTLPDDQR